MRQVEAETLVELIADVRKSKWQVLDQDDGTWRPANYADIAVLVPTRTGLSRLLPELEGTRHSISARKSLAGLWQ